MSKENEQPNWLSTKSILTFVLPGIAIFAILVFLGDYRQIIENLPQINLAVIPILILCTLANIALRFAKWEYFLRVLNIRVSFANSILVFLSGLSMIITPGKVGEVLKSYLLKQTDQVEISKSIMVVVAERLTDVSGLAILSLIGLSSFFIRWYALLFIFILLIIMILILRNEFVFLKLRSFSAKVPILRNYAEYLTQAYEASTKLFSFRTLVISTFISTISWFFECLALYILLADLGQPISIFASTFVFSFSSIFGAILVLPGGLGAAEGSFMGLLLALHLPKSTAAMATIIIRVCTLWFGVALGLFSLLLFRRRIGIMNRTY